MTRKHFKIRAKERTTGQIVTPDFITRMRSDDSINRKNTGEYYNTCRSYSRELRLLV